MIRKILIGLFSVVCLPALAGEMVHYQKDFTASGQVSIKNDRGSVTISGWEQAKISVQSEADEQLDSFVFEVNQGEATIEVPVEKGRKLGQPTNLSVKIPFGTSVVISGVSSSLKITAMRGNVSVKTINGDVHVEQLSGPLQVSSISGATDIRQLEGTLFYESISGDLNADLNSESVQLKTVSGDIRLDVENNRQMEITSVSGNINVSGGFKEYPDIAIKTVSGDIQMGLSGSVDAKLTVASVLNTDVHVNLPQSGLTDLAISAKQFAHNIGSGVGKILLSTVQGEISVTER